VAHLRHWKLAGFTTGSGCLAPTLSAAVYSACRAADYERAQQLCSRFMDLDDLRDEWGPARVLHHALELDGIARKGLFLPSFQNSLKNKGTPPDLWCRNSSRDSKSW
jgi:dihydrodipicolinate synthase/N-acetylneuraminate lyase